MMFSSDFRDTEYIVLPFAVSTTFSCSHLSSGRFRHSLRQCLCRRYRWCHCDDEPDKGNVPCTLPGTSTENTTCAPPQTQSPTKLVGQFSEATGSRPSLEYFQSGKFDLNLSAVWTLFYNFIGLFHI